MYHLIIGNFEKLNFIRPSQQRGVAHHHLLQPKPLCIAVLFPGPFVVLSSDTMHLMYYLGDDGKRVYTLKVRMGMAGCRAQLACSPPVSCVLCKQKVDPTGKATVSAHPGVLRVMF